jgi:O-antigen/teichoic acid export membrane protein
MLIAMPLSALRLPTVLVLERQLSYGILARVEVADALAGYAWAIVTVAAGAGVWGLATSIPVRALVGSVLMIRSGPLGWVWPIWGWALVRPMLGFGLRFQAINVVTAARDQGLNFGIAAIGSISSLGLWSLAFRLMQVPFMILISLWRVSYPAMSRLLEADENPRAVIERGAGVAAVALSPVLVGIAAGAPDLLPWLIGDSWEDVPSILVWASLGMMISASVSIPTVGYLLAAGEVSAVLVSVSAGTVVWLTVGLGLLSPVGVAAIGLGWVAMGLVEASLLGRRTARRTGARIAPNVGPPIAVAVIAVVAGRALGTVPESEHVAGFASLVVAELVLLLGLRALAWDALRATVRLSGRAVASARAT